MTVPPRERLFHGRRGGRDKKTARSGCLHGVVHRSEDETTEEEAELLPWRWWLHPG